MKYNLICAISPIRLSALICGLFILLESCEKKQADDKQRFEKIEADLEKIEIKISEHEEKNKFFRHNFDSVTKSLEILISSEIKHLGEIIGLQIKNILEKINEKK